MKKKNIWRNVLLYASIVLLLILNVMQAYQIIQRVIDRRIEAEMTDGDHLLNQLSEEEQNDIVSTENEIITESDYTETEADYEETDNSEGLLNETDIAERVEALVMDMSLEEKVAQMFIVTPEQLCNSDEPITEVTDSLKQALMEKPVGGIAFFSQNITNRNQTQSLLTEINKENRISLFLALDEEGGTVARVASNPAMEVPVTDSMGKIQDGDSAFQAGNTIGNYLKDLGFNLNFAPVADINSNPENIIIGERAFATDGTTAAPLVASCVKGMKSAGILTTLKHFPGHGDTLEDSHQGTAHTYKTLDEMRNNEWLPFISGIEAGTDLIMVGHITCDQVENRPASLSTVMVSGLLRDVDQLNFQGLIITDAMNMQAITQEYDSAQASILAIQAGVDLILMPENLDVAIAGVVDAVHNGTIGESVINDRVTRIISKKIESGIYEME